MAHKCDTDLRTQAAHATECPVWPTTQEIKAIARPVLLSPANCLFSSPCLVLISGIDKCTECRPQSTKKENGNVPLSPLLRERRIVDLANALKS